MLHLRGDSFVAVMQAAEPRSATTLPQLIKRTLPLGKFFAGQDAFDLRASNGCNRRATDSGAPRLPR